jgi:hypothetical protein
MLQRRAGSSAHVGVSDDDLVLELLAVRVAFTPVLGPPENTIDTIGHTRGYR